MMPTFRKNHSQPWFLHTNVTAEKKVNFCLCLIKHYASKMCGETKV